MKPNGKILLIGGYADGLRRSVPQSPQFHMTTRLPHGPTYGSSLDPSAPCAFTTTTYRTHRLRRADGTEAWVAVCTDKKDDLVDLLIKGYRGHRNPRRKKYPIHPAYKGGPW